MIFKKDSKARYGQGGKRRDGADQRDYETNRSVKEPVGLFDLQERAKQFRKKAKSRVKPVMTVFCVSSLSPLIPTWFKLWDSIQQEYASSDLFSLADSNTMSAWRNQWLLAITRYSVGIAHRDLKAEAVGWKKKGGIKRTDFGMFDCDSRTWFYDFRSSLSYIHLFYSKTSVALILLLPKSNSILLMTAVENQICGPGYCHLLFAWPSKRWPLENNLFQNKTMSVTLF